MFSNPAMKRLLVVCVCVGINCMFLYEFSNTTTSAGEREVWMLSTDVPNSMTKERSTAKYTESLSKQKKGAAVDIMQNKAEVVDNTQPSSKDYIHRVLALKEACSKRGTPQSQKFNPDLIDYRVRTERSHSILYCNIPKVGSTFWKRVLTIMKTDMNSSSAFFDKNFASQQPMSFYQLKKTLSEKEMKQFLKQSFSFMFVRDPYARLYSGYENKLYNPNKKYWRALGTEVVKRVRINATMQSLKYGHDVTFSEFVEYILELWENGEKLDAHFGSMHSKCDPCIMPYHFLGKLETFQADTYYLLNLWQKKFSDFKIKFDDFEKETAMDTGKVHIMFAFNAWRSMRGSKFGYPLYKFLFRAWSDLQIRGYLSKNIPLPYKPSEVEKLRTEDVIEALRKALDIPVDRTKVRLQRSEALTQAYQTIPLETMKRVRKFVLEDCQLFGYDDRPQMLFKRNIVDTNEHMYLNGI